MSSSWWFSTTGLFLIGIPIAVLGAWASWHLYEFLTKLRLETYGLRGVPLELFCRDVDFHQHTRRPKWFEHLTWQTGNLAMWLADWWTHWIWARSLIAFAVSGVMAAAWYFHRKRSFVNVHETTPSL